MVGKARKKINVAVINEAYAPFRDTLRWVLANLNKVAENFGGRLEFVNLLALDAKEVKERIGKSDVIFVVGGNTDYLMSVFNKTGFSQMLPQLLKTKVYVGSSAGSMVLGKRLSTKAYEKIYGERGTFGINQYLGLVNLCFMPHLDSEDFPNRKETLIDAVKDHHGAPVYGLRDDSAIIVEGETMTTIGSEPLIFK